LSLYGVFMVTSSMIVSTVQQGFALMKRIVRDYADTTSLDHDEGCAPGVTVKDLLHLRRGYGGVFQAHSDQGVTPFRLLAIKAGIFIPEIRHW
jgi:hypothetical protein